MAQSVGDRVQARIEELKLNSAEVARMAGLERTFVHDLVSGRKKTITAEALVSLAMALHCLPEDLVGKHGAIPRDGTDEIEIVGIVEQDVWRGSMPRNLGKITAPNGGSPAVRAYIVRGDEAMPIGIEDGSALIVDTAHQPHHGDIAVVQRTREGLRELSLRKVIDAEGQTLLLSLGGEPEKIIQMPSNRGDETITLIGRVQRAVLLFPSAAA